MISIEPKWISENPEQANVGRLLVMMRNASMSWVVSSDKLISSLLHEDDELE